MNRGMAGPAGADLQKRRVVGVADVNVAGGNIRSLHLCVAAQTKVRIGFDQHLLVDGTMRVVAHGASFTHGFVFKNKRMRLGLVA